jgi:hypothetical protein
MFLDPNTLAENLDLIEAIEKGSTRFVTQAIELFREHAIDIFASESDLQADIGEDITAEALDSVGMSRSAQRKTARGIAENIHLPDRGNSHMLMMDTNNLQVADIILAWLIDKVR